MTPLSIGFSPCPNDTFIFDNMINNNPSSANISFDCVLEDVETLNQWAFEEKLDITKLSYSAFLHLSDKYDLLDTGSALGFGVGPLLITTKEKFESINDINSFVDNANIAIPGIHTSANLLLSLAFPNAKQKTEVLFSDIESKVLDGTFDAGLIIHENRFTYTDRGLSKILDCGEWWEQNTQSAIPLGGIVVRKNIPFEIKQLIKQLIKDSIQKSWEKYPILSDYVINNAQEMSEDVMRKHINLYVNEHTFSLGSIGINAVNTLFLKAKNAGIIHSIPENFII